MAGSTTWAASKSAYGNVDNFQHNFIMSALEGTGEFAGKSEAYRAGAASYSMHFAVPALMAIASIETSGATANWDLAYAYFHGSTPAALTNSSHVTLPAPDASMRSMITAICFIVGSRPS